MAGLCVPLLTLRLHPHGCPRMTRGRCGLLILQRNGLSPSIPCRSSRRTTKNQTLPEALQATIGKKLLIICDRLEPHRSKLVCAYTQWTQTSTPARRSQQDAAHCRDRCTTCRIASRRARCIASADARCAIQFAAGAVPENRLRQAGFSVPAFRYGCAHRDCLRASARAIGDVERCGLGAEPKRSQQYVGIAALTRRE
jgi:hypothetical protein